MGVEDLRIKAKEVSVRGQPRENSSRTVVESVMPGDPFTIQQSWCYLCSDGPYCVHLLECLQEHTHHYESLMFSSHL